MENFSQENKEKITLNKYKPNILIIIGVIFNVIFAAIFSLIFPLLLLTIPTIILNLMLLIPRVGTKRYLATWRVIPIILSFFLAILLFLSIFFLLTFTKEVYDSFSNFIDKYIIFWKKDVMPDWNNMGFIKKILEIVFIIIGFTGNTLLLFGWYKKIPIGQIDVFIETKKIKTPKTKKDKNNPEIELDNKKDSKEKQTSKDSL